MFQSQPLTASALPWITWKIEPYLDHQSIKSLFSPNGLYNPRFDFSKWIEFPNKKRESTLKGHSDFLKTLFRSKVNCNKIFCQRDWFTISCDKSCNHFSSQVIQQAELERIWSLSFWVGLMENVSYIILWLQGCCCSSWDGNIHQVDVSSTILMQETQSFSQLV